jgi:hypothetical protein
LNHKLIDYLIALAILISAILSACTPAQPAPVSDNRPLTSYQQPTPFASLPGGHTTTTWSVEPNIAMDALCFFGTLTGDRIYLQYYRSEYDRFAPKLTPEVMDALAYIKKVVEQENSLICVELTQLFLPLAPKNLDDLIKAIDNPDTIRLSYNLAPDSESWQLFLNHIPKLRTVLSWLKEIGFEKDYLENIYPKIEAKAKELGQLVPTYNIIPAVEAALGSTLPSDRITIYLSYFVQPFGIGIDANQFLLWSELDLKTIIDDSIHENLHLLEIQEPALWEALNFLQQDDYYMKNFNDHDFSYGYTTIDGYVEEDVIEALDQYLAEKFYANEDPRLRWSNALPGMHKLSPVLYSLLKEANYSPAEETYHDFIIRMVQEGKLKAGMIESANRRFFAGG